MRVCADNEVLLRFPSNSCNQLASADKSGRVTVWDITREADTVDGREIGTFILSGMQYGNMVRMLCKAAPCCQGLHRLCSCAGSRLRQLRNARSSHHAHHMLFGCAGSPGAASSDGMPAPQAQVAFHVTDGMQPVLAMALGQTLYLASLDRPNAEPAHSAIGPQQWDCTDVAALPLSSMTSLQLPHTVCCLAFDSSGSKLAAVSTERQVCCSPHLLSSRRSARFASNAQNACGWAHCLAYLLLDCAFGLLMCAVGCSTYTTHGNCCL